MHNALPLVLALTFAGTQMQAQAPGIGDTLAGFPVLVEGKQVPFERFVGDVPVAIFLWGAPLKASSCSELAKAATKLAGERVRLLSVEPIAKRCPDIPNVYRPAATEIEQLSAGSARMMIVDTTAIIRLIQPVDANAVGISGAAATAVEWEGGRQSFITQCGHCHGSDGADTSYAGIKTLERISKRMSDQRILEGGQEFGAVDMTSWSKSAKDALLLYIRGL